MSGGYARAGLVGVLTPQANTVAEPELAALIGPDIVTLGGRMTSAASDMLSRLEAYAFNLAATLEQFGDAPLDVAAFACTGSTYVLADHGVDLEAEIGSRLHVPLVTAGGAVRQALQSLDCRRLNLLSPYPPDLTRLAVNYWQRRGYVIGEVAVASSSKPGHPIYGLEPSDLLKGVGPLESDCDAVLIMGTGAPSLPLVRESGPPVLTSNFCLGWAVMHRLRSVQLTTMLSADADWRRRLDAAYPSA